jgi:hypothetical protein
MAKSPRPAMQGKKRPYFQRFPEGKTPKELSQKYLCALCFLFVHPLVFIRGGSRETEILIPRKGKRTTNRREPGGRREDEILIK